MSRSSLTRALKFLVVSAAALLTVAGCSSAKHASNDPSAASPIPSSASSSASVPAGLGGGAGEEGSTAPRSTIITTPSPHLSAGDVAQIDKPCPYADNDSMRDAEGDRTVRSVQLATNPVGCRYFFEYDETVIIVEIRVQRFATAVDAYNAVAIAAQGHPEVVGDTTIGDGSVTIKLPLQGLNTWACIFSKGNLVVTAHTRQTVVGQDARNVARLIEPNIK
ncbi:hypothetical protein ACSMXN_00155 [Jatrophihabitans sp. DSM 45814]